MDIWQIQQDAATKIEPISELPESGVIWIDAGQGDVRKVIDYTEQLTKISVYERHIEDCLNLEHPSFYDSVQGYDILIIRSLISQNFKNCTETRPISCLIFNHLLVTFSAEDPAIGRIKAKLENTRKRLPFDSLSLLLFILDEVIDNFLELRGVLLGRLSYWQRKLFTNSQQQMNWFDFLDFKTEIRKLRILSEDQQEVVYQWRQDNEMGLTDYLAIRFNDLSEHIRRIIRYASQLESDLDTLIEIYYSLISNRTNDVVRILTVLSAIFLPLNLIAGIFGMNFEKMHLTAIPQGEDLVLIGMSLLAVVLFIVFKWKRWI